MRPVMQTLFGADDGNCFPACLASLLECDLGCIPNFCQDSPRAWLRECQQWLSEQYHLGLVSIDATRRVDVPAGALCIVSGKSPRFDGVDHSVIGRTVIREGFAYFEFLHDPHPSGDFLGGDKAKWAEFLIPLDPQAASLRPQT